MLETEKLESTDVYWTVYYLVCQNDSVSMGTSSVDTLSPGSKKIQQPETVISITPYKQAC